MIKAVLIPIILGTIPITLVKNSIQHIKRRVANWLPLSFGVVNNFPSYNYSAAMILISTL